MAGGWWHQWYHLPSVRDTIATNPRAKQARKFTPQEPKVGFRILISSQRLAGHKDKQFGNEIGIHCFTFELSTVAREIRFRFHAHLHNWLLYKLILNTNRTEQQVKIVIFKTY